MAQYSTMNQSPRMSADSKGPMAEDRRGRVIPAAELLRGGRELWIEHRGERYRLTLTRNDKLILTK